MDDASDEMLTEWNGWDKIAMWYNMAPVRPYGRKMGVRGRAWWKGRGREGRERRRGDGMTGSGTVMRD